MTTTVIDHIGLLITNDPAFGEGPLGKRHDASIVIEDGQVIAVQIGPPIGPIGCMPLTSAFPTI